MSSAPAQLRIALYVRVSTPARKRAPKPDAPPPTPRQDVGLQLDELRAEARHRKWEIVAEFTDEESGKNDDRSGLLRALAAAERREYDVLVVWKLDRLARSLRRLLEVVDTVTALNIGLVSLRDPGIDTTTPTGRLVLQILGAVAEFERELIVERVRAGVERVKATGKTRSGKPIGRPSRDVDPERVRQLRDEGRTWRAIAMAVGVPVRTVRRAVAKPIA